ncbi:MAG: peptide deformylase [Bacteroidales bacterium]|jgi:peptide deformylase|nr:peptide deformylase [Bacteroidales bacterium]
MKKTITRLAFLLAVVLLFPGRSCTFSSWEKRVVRQQDSVLYVTTLWQDSTILRTPSTNLSHRELQSAVLQTLEAKMLRTVMDPSQDGVGIAAPQVGINRRVVWVQRLDKEGEPFECYENIQIDSLFGETVLLEEGCLSVPPLRGRVPRSSGVVVSYLRDGKRVTETVEGYTARIFQHECDHLDGILYIDRADTVFTHDSWAAERAAFDYTRPAWW